MSFFSDEEIDSLKITRMILHVVGTKEFEAMPERALEEEAFFIGKIVAWQPHRCLCSKPCQ